MLSEKSNLYGLAYAYTTLQRHHKCLLLFKYVLTMPHIEKKIIWIVLFIVQSFILPAQSYTLQIHIHNQPDNKVFLFALKGDQINLIDSAIVNSGVVRFNLSENIPAGIYRLLLGQTIYAKVLIEPQQHLDFIFNKEDILLQTDFKVPVDSLKIIKSEENRVWFGFLKKEKEYREKLKYAKIELDYYQLKRDTLNIQSKAKEYNHLQKDRENFINHIVAENQNLFASKLINMYHIPFMDGHYSQQERKEVFNAEYFKQLDFTEEALINSSVYTEKVFYYFHCYAQRSLTKEQQEQEFQKALNVILEKCSQNEKVYAFILDYLVRGFEILKMDNLIQYIAGKYSRNTCQSDNKSTLERRFGAQKMNIGDTVPDFTLNDINNNPIKLSEVVKGNNLIIFWMSGCQHCKNMIPEIKKGLSQNRNIQFEVIAVSLDVSKDEWEKGIFDLGIQEWYNLSDLRSWNGKVMSDYNVYATPTMFIIDRNLKIIAKPSNLNDILIP